jgi:hypothetical protein
MVNVESGDFDDHPFGDALPEKVSVILDLHFRKHFATSVADPRKRTARVAFHQLQFDCWAWAETNIRWQHVSQG